MPDKVVLNENNKSVSDALGLDEDRPCYPEKGKPALKKEGTSYALTEEEDDTSLHKHNWVQAEWLRISTLGMSPKCS